MTSLDFRHDVPTRPCLRREVFIVVTLNIRLGAAEEIRSFVNLANHYPFTIILRQDRFTVDAKSLMGIYSLDLRTPITVEAYTSQAGNLIDTLMKYSV